MIRLCSTGDIFIGKERKFKYLGIICSFDLPEIPRIGMKELRGSGVVVLEFMNEGDAKEALKFMKISFPGSKIVRSSWGNKEIEYFTPTSFREAYYRRVTFDISLTVSRENFHEFLEILRKIHDDLGYKIPWFLDNRKVIIR